MNKEEAKEAIKRDLADVVIEQSGILNIIDKIELDQPKTVLKKEHAEWLEELKNEFPDNLPNQLYHITRQGWGYGLVFESNTGQKIKISNLDGGKLKKDLVNALIYGYTVEKEKLYTVEIPDPNSKDTVYYLFKNEDGQVEIGSVLFLDTEPDDSWRDDPDMQLTEQEIKKDFEWALKWKKEVI